MQTFTTNCKLVGDKIIAGVGLVTKTQHPCEFEFLFEGSRLYLFMFFVAVTALSGSKIYNCIGHKSMGAIFESQALQHFFSDTICQFLLGQSKIQIICMLFQLFELVYIKKYSEKVVVELRLSELCALKIEKPENDCFFEFSLCFGEFNLTWCIVHMIKFHEKITINGSMRISII